MVQIYFSLTTADSLKFIVPTDVLRIEEVEILSDRVVFY